MTVYLVSTGSYSDWSVRGIFSTKARAIIFMGRAKKDAQNHEDGVSWAEDFNDIEEWKVDVELKSKRHIVWSVGIMLDDGSLREQQEREEWGVPATSSYVAERAPAYGGRGIVRAVSCKSKAHAFKLATEARQRWHAEEAR